MTKRILSLLVLVAILLVFTASAPVSENNVSDMSGIELTETVTNVIKARFENMLNHNYLYNDDFTSHKIIIENSILALLDKQQDGEISEDLVLGFIAGMYGLQVDPSSAKYDFAPASEGMFAVLPRGYTEYNHTITDVVADEYGYIVTSTVKVMPHDGDEYVTTAKTVFVSNEGSSFGYNIISSSLF